MMSILQYFFLLLCVNYAPIYKVQCMKSTTVHSRIEMMQRCLQFCSLFTTEQSLFASRMTLIIVLEDNMRENGDCGTVQCASC